MDYVRLLLLALDLIKRFTVWMERNSYIQQGVALQIKANLEASYDVLEKARAAYRDGVADNPVDGLRRDIQDPNSRD